MHVLRRFQKTFMYFLGLDDSGEFQRTSREIHGVSGWFQTNFRCVLEELHGSFSIASRMSHVVSRKISKDFREVSKGFQGIRRLVLKGFPKGVTSRV